VVRVFESRFKPRPKRPPTDAVRVTS